MDFAEWLTVTRTKNQLSMNQLASKSGLHVSTVARLENGQTQATLYTAQSLCTALNVTLADFAWQLDKKRLPKVNHGGSGGQRSTLLLKDVQAFLDDFHRDSVPKCQFLAKTLNGVIESYPGGHPALHGKVLHLNSDDIEKILVQSAIYRFEISDPADLPVDVLLQTARHGGVLSVLDVRRFVSQWMAREGLTVFALRDLTGLTHDFLPQLEFASVHGTKLADIFKLDGLLGKKCEGLTIYWSAGEFSVLASGHSIRGSLALPLPGWTGFEPALANLLIKIYRWLQCIDLESAKTWVRELRDEVKAS